MERVNQKRKLSNYYHQEVQLDYTWNCLCPDMHGTHACTKSMQRSSAEHHHDHHHHYHNILHSFSFFFLSVMIDLL